MKDKKSYLREWNELIAIPLAILVWVLSPYFMRWIDPTSAPIDAGVFHIIIFALISFLVISVVVWTFIKVNWPGLYMYIDNQMEQDIWKSSTHQRVWVATAWYLGLFFCFALLVNALPM